MKLEPSQDPHVPGDFICAGEMLHCVLTTSEFSGGLEGSAHGTPRGVVAQCQRLPSVASGQPGGPLQSINSMVLQNAPMV